MSEKNLLLINMSILPQPGKLGENYYSGKLRYDLHNDQPENECYFCGVSQLEAGTKYFLRKLQTEGAKLDQIFIVESPETQHELRTISEVSRYLANDKDYMFLECEEDPSKTNAVRFYKERICQYIQGREKGKRDLEHLDLKDKIDNYEHGLGPLFSSNEELKKLFTDIEIDREIDQRSKAYKEQTVLFKGVQELCQKIQAFTEDGSVVNLYLYMQGGKRHEAFIINAAVNMLRMRDIKVKASVTVDFNDGKGFKNIVDSTLDDRIFEMVSGMNEFIATGRGDTLLSFCDNAEGLIGLEAEKEIIQAIREISNSLSLCDTKSFPKDIKNFRTKLEEYNNQPDDSKNRLFQTFITDLEEDYNTYGLLDRPLASPNIALAKWCKAKKLYQQALTMLEAHSPSDIVQNKVITYGENPKQDLPVFLKKLQKLGWNNDLKHLTFPKSKYFLIHSILANDKKELGIKKKDDFLKNNLYIDGKDENDIKISELLKYYKEICDMRNKINHAAGEVSIDEADSLIEKYINCYENLLNEKVSVNLSQRIKINENLLARQESQDGLTQGMSFSNIDVGSLPES